MNIRCERVDLAEFKPVLAAHVLTLASPIDSYLEDHLLQARPYRILVDGEGAGWTAIHNLSLITHFSLDAPHRHRGQRVFAQVRKLEQVREAYVPTCDEFFLAHALDEYRLLEKQAYFFQARPGAQRPLSAARLDAPPRSRRGPRADDDAGRGLLRPHVEWRVADGQITVAECDGEIAGFGVIERSTLYAAAASIGMITVEAQRGRGVGTAIIGALLDECARQQLTAIAGCWYYNHFSKQTLEKAGMYTQTRLLKVSY
jgi:GNAT superfamily N-acetyltransferase